MIPAVFLDRDGVINVNRDDYVKSWDEFQFLPTALSALRLLSTLALPIIVTTNQSIIGRGFVSRQVVDDIHQRMRHAVVKAGGRIDEVFYCPHRPDQGCDCRKPLPGMLLQAAAKMSIDLARSFMIGDAESDIQASRAAGCRSIFVKSGRGNELLNHIDHLCYHDLYIAEDLNEAAQWVIEHASVIAGTQQREAHK